MPATKSSGHFGDSSSINPMDERVVVTNGGTFSIWHAKMQVARNLGHPTYWQRLLAEAGRLTPIEAASTTPTTMLRVANFVEGPETEAIEYVEMVSVEEPDDLGW